MAERRPSLTLRAYGKINWTLELLGRRPDGYHEVRTVMQNISLGDRITMMANPGPDLVVQCTHPGIPPGAGNLCYRAAILLRHTTGVRTGARILIDKHIPVGAGLGGGSSDAAATLVGLNRIWETDLSREELIPLAAALGADVPFFLQGGAGIGTGRGDWVRPLPSPAGVPLILAQAPFQLATAAVYGQVRGFRPQAGENTRRLEELLHLAEIRGRRQMPQDSGSPPRDSAPSPWLEDQWLAEMGAALINDLEEPACALQPELRTCLSELRQSEVAGAGMSGSGPTLFALPNRSDNLSAQDCIAQWGGGWRAQSVHTVARGWEPEVVEEP